MIAVLVLALAAASPLPRPSPAVLRRAFEAGQHAVVQVSSPRGKGLGVVVGSQGEVLTYVGFVNLKEATVRLGDKTWVAQVRFAQADLGVALLSLSAPEGEKEGGPFPAVAVYSNETPTQGWVLGLGPGKKGQMVPKLGAIRGARAAKPDPGFFRVDVALPLGSPVLDLKGRLLGMVVGHSPGGSRAVAIPTLKAELAGTAP